MTYSQQGDELFFETDALPKGVKAVKSGVIIQSPVTGHAHRLKTGKLFKLGEAFYVKAPATVVHEEHDPIDLSNGVYEVKTVQEYDHLTEESRNVID